MDPTLRITLRGAAPALLLWALASSGCIGAKPAAPVVPTKVVAPAPPPAASAPPASICRAIDSTLSDAPAVINGVGCSAATASVVLVLLEDAAGKPVGYCSGAVIASNAVLTAAHCLTGDTKRVAIMPAGPGGIAVPAASFEAIAQYVDADPESPDVGVVTVAGSLGRAALPLLVSSDPVQGETVVFAGYGVDSNGSEGALLAGSGSVVLVGGNFIAIQYSNGIGSNPCNGDSGGPLVVLRNGAWALAGVTSAGTTEDCKSGYTDFARVSRDPMMSFILARVPGVTPK